MLHPGQWIPEHQVSEGPEGDPGSLRGQGVGVLNIYSDLKALTRDIPKASCMALGPVPRA